MRRSGSAPHRRAVLPGKRRYHTRRGGRASCMSAPGHASGARRTAPARSWRKGEYTRAEELLQESLSGMQLNDAKAEVYRTIGLVALDRGDLARAEEALTATLRLGSGGNMVWLAAPTLEGIAGVAVARGQT